MSLGLVGRKIGMTRIFTEDGTSVPVTVVDVSNNRVTQIKTPETDGYTAVQVAFGTRRKSRVTQPLAGHYAKAGVDAVVFSKNSGYWRRCCQDEPWAALLLLTCFRSVKWWM